MIQEQQSVILDTVLSPLRVLLALLRLIFLFCAVICAGAAMSTGSNGEGRWQAVVFLALSWLVTTALRRR